MCESYKEQAYSNKVDNVVFAAGSWFIYIEGELKRMYRWM